MLISKNLLGDMLGCLGFWFYVSVVLVMFFIIFYCLVFGDFKWVIWEDKKKNMKNINGEKIWY